MRPLRTANLEDTNSRCTESNLPPPAHVGAVKERGFHHPIVSPSPSTLRYSGLGESGTAAKLAARRGGFRWRRSVRSSTVACQTRLHAPEGGVADAVVLALVSKMGQTLPGGSIVPDDFVALDCQVDGVAALLLSCCVHFSSTRESSSSFLGRGGLLDGRGEFPPDVNVVGIRLSM